MPLIGKKPFVREKPPADLHPDEELFYCKLTHEVFREYEQFFDRVILCNSLVWTCAVTGKPGLTYQEALESEKTARKSLKKFPEPLKRPILYLARLTKRNRLNDMCDDVFAYMKDRYFIGESVEVSINGAKKAGVITQIIIPEKQPKSPDGKQEKPKKPKSVHPEKIKYEIQEKGSNRKIIAKAPSITRPKGTYTKPLNKLFIKQNAESKNGVWALKAEAVTKNNLDNFKLNNLFPNSLPKYASSPTKRKVSGVPEKKEKEAVPEKKNTPDSTTKKSVQGKLSFKKETAEEKKRVLIEQAEFEKQRLIAEKDRQKRKEEIKKSIEEARLKLKEQRLKEREQKKEERRIIAEYLSTWRKPRDDLECDDLRDLPIPVPVDCNIPQGCFGDALMVLEFLNSFGDFIHLKDSFPHGFTFEHLEKALTETDIQGCLNDLLQLLLVSVFQLQENDAEDGIRKQDVKIDDNTDLTPEKAMSLASVAASWPQLYHGTLLRNMPLDSFSITEVLRFHILSSGACRGPSTQGLSGISEDPGLWFKIEESELVKKLSYTSVFQLSCEDRVKILTLLTNQLLLCAPLRNAMEENFAKAGPLKMELRQLRWTYARKRKEDTLNKQKKKPDDKSNENNTENGSTEQNQNEEKAENQEDDKASNQEEEKDNTDSLSPEEKLELEEMKKKEAARRKADFLRKERELKSQIQRLESSFNITPIGRDRAYRRFWVFNSVPGVFVEDDDKFVGSCLLKQTAQIPTPAAAAHHNDLTSPNIRKYLQHLGDPNGSSDKENDILYDLAMIQSGMSLAPQTKDRKLTDLNPRVDFKKNQQDGVLQEGHGCAQCKDKVDLQSNFPRFCPHKKSPSLFGLCTASIENCPVHNINAPRTKWSFFYKIEDIDELISNLNTRGFRERSLHKALLEEKEGIKEQLDKFQYHMFNKMLPPPPQLEVRKSQRLQNSLRPSEYADIKPEDALELTLRDMILELEHRIYAGALGSIKVADREAWKTAIENQTYDMQCDEVKLSSEIGDAVKQETPVVVNQVVKDLSCALLQISQGIESKFLNPPLGETDNFKQQKQKALNNVANWEARQKNESTENEKDQNSCPKVPLSPLQLWQQSLMQCSSLSQLFVHLGTLERSIAWSRSVLKAHCKICRRRGDAENMLLCDGCNRGHHLYCLKPPLKSIPEGDWFCLSCKPPEKAPSPRKTKEDRGDLSAEESESEENSDVDVVSEDVEEEDEEDEEYEEDGDSEIAGYEVCEACGDAGTVICCDKCPLVYHPECVGLRRIPRGEWLCPKCTKKNEAVKKSQRSSSSGAYSTRTQSLINGYEPQKAPTLKTKIPVKGTKRNRQESTDSESYPPSKRACAETRRSTRNINNEKENSSEKADKEVSSSVARRRSRPGSDGLLDYKTCFDLINELMRHPSSWPFLIPVSKKDAPDYHLVIKRPMDFGTIRSNLNNMNYTNNDDFVRDIYLVLQNCELFNPRSSHEYKAARDLYKEVRKLLQEYQLPNTFSANKLLKEVES